MADVVMGGDALETRPVPALAHQSFQIFTWPPRRCHSGCLAVGEGLGLPLSHPKHNPIHKGLALLLLTEAPSPGAGDAGMMLQE